MRRLAKKLLLNSILEWLEEEFEIGEDNLEYHMLYHDVKSELAKENKK